MTCHDVCLAIGLKAMTANHGLKPESESKVILPLVSCAVSCCSDDSVPLTERTGTKKLVHYSDYLTTRFINLWNLFVGGFLGKLEDES